MYSSNCNSQQDISCSEGEENYCEKGESFLFPSSSFSLSSPLLRKSHSCQPPTKGHYEEKEKKGERRRRREEEERTFSI